MKEIPIIPIRCCRYTPRKKKKRIIFRVGDRVRFKRAWTFSFPHFSVPAGTTGLIDYISPNGDIHVRADTKIIGAEYWNNTVHIYNDYADNVEDYLEKI